MSTEACRGHAWTERKGCRVASVTGADLLRRLQLLKVSAGGSSRRTFKSQKRDAITKSRTTRSDQEEPDVKMLRYLIRPASGRPERSPLTEATPEGAGLELAPGRVTARELWGYGVWGALTVVFLFFELSGIDDVSRWPTLSTTAANLQREHPWTAMLILGGLAVLAARIVFYPWPNRHYDR